MSALSRPPYELGGTTDTAEYGYASDPERDQGPDVTSCATCGRLAIDHTEGRWSIYGTCPRRDLIVARSRTRPQVVRARTRAGGTADWVVIADGDAYPFSTRRSALRSAARHDFPVGFGCWYDSSAWVLA